jgi:hypothetical protein
VRILDFVLSSKASYSRKSNPPDDTTELATRVLIEEGSSLQYEAEQRQKDDNKNVVIR